MLQTNPPGVTIWTLPIQFDRSHSFDDIVAAGRFDVCDRRITSMSFPLSPPPELSTGLIRGHIITFNLGKCQRISTEHVLGIIDDLGYCPGCLWGMSMLAAAAPGIQRRFEIVALGSHAICPITGYDHVPFVGLTWERRVLGLHIFPREWEQRHSFLVYNKHQLQAA